MHDDAYLRLLSDVLHYGHLRTDRTGVGTIGGFGYQVRYALSDGFPLLTSKRLHWRSIVGELLWFLRGDTNTAWLNERGITIWDEWCSETGELGPIYGSAWRDFGGATNMPGAGLRGIDQIADVIDSLRRDPYSRRHIVTAWNPLSVADAALPPCHTLFQFHVSPDEDGTPAVLNCQLYQRSGDLFLGAPFNIASYSLLTHIIALEVGMWPGVFVHTLGDAHIYLNHVDQVREQLARPIDRPAPRLVIHDADRDQASPMFPLPEYDIGSFELVGYDPYPAITAPVAV